MTTTTNYRDYSFTYRGIKATLTHIGEGYDGDYDPSDPDDAPLYRVDLNYTHDQYADNGTCCTCIVAGRDDDYREIARRISGYAHARHLLGDSLQSIATGVSWFSNDSLTDHQGVTA